MLCRSSYQSQVYLVSKKEHLQTEARTFLILRTAAHCFCPDKNIRDIYCTNEIVKRERHLYNNMHELSIYLGVRNSLSVEKGMGYKIESVRVPKERIAMYARHNKVGPDDIALVKTQKSMVFLPGKIMPVCYLILFI